MRGDTVRCRRAADPAVMFADAIDRDLPIAVHRRGALVDVIVRPIERVA